MYGFKASRVSARALPRMWKRRTLNDFQKLCGNLNWILPYCKPTTEELLPLLKILEGDSQLTSPPQLTPEAAAVLKKVEKCFKSTVMQRCDLSQPILLLKKGLNRLFSTIYNLLLPGKYLKSLKQKMARHILLLTLLHF